MLLRHAFFLADPRQYKWNFVGNSGNSRSRVVFLERSLPSGVVRLNYYYTTGTCQLVHDNKYYSGEGGPKDPRRVQETFRDLTEQQFASMLHNPPNFYCAGWKELLCSDADSGSCSDNSSEQSSDDCAPTYARYSYY